MDRTETLPTLPGLEEEYELVRVLGRGATSIIYLARERELGREVAIKLIRPGFLPDEEAVARLVREARTLGKLQHPGIVMLLGTRRVGELGLALVLQYVPGVTLRARLEERGPLPFEEVERVLADVSRALAYAHAHRIVHRDIKPENVYLDDESGVARLADFGIARSWDPESGLTFPGMAIGTPTYMSPEQVDGLTLDGRSDLYSLGLVGYEMLTGRKPWARESLYGVIYKQKHESLPPPSSFRAGIPPRLERAIEGALRKDRDARWPDAATFLAALEGKAKPGARPHGGRPGRGEEADVVDGGPGAGTPIPAAAESDAESWPPPELEAVMAVYHGTQGGGGGATAAGAPPSPLDPPPTPGPGRRARATPLPGPATAAYRERPWWTDRRVTRSLGAAVFVALALLLFSPDRTSLPPDYPRGGLASPGAERAAPPSGAEGSARAESGAEGGFFSTGPLTLLEREGAGPRDGAGARGEGAEASSFEAPGTVEGPDVPGDAGAPPPADGAAAGGPPGEPDAAAGGPEDADAAAPPRVARLEVIRGEGQTAVAGATLAEPLTVRVMNEEGRAMEGVPIVFEVVSGGGGTEPLRAMTGPGGTASTLWTLGSTVREQLLLARVEEPEEEGTAGASPGAAGVAGAGAVTAGSTPETLFRALLEEPVVVETEEDEDAARGGEAPGEEAGEEEARETPDGAEAGPPPLAIRPTVLAGGTFTCVLGADGSLACWGANDDGQLGDGGRSPRLRPSGPVGGSPFAVAAAGLRHACALDLEGRAWCWGAGSVGASPVAAGARFTEIAAGVGHTCALAADGSVRCWGANDRGQLGDGTRELRSAPVEVRADVRFTRVFAGWRHTCALDAQGFAWCWGDNTEGQLGSGSREGATEPRLVVGGHRFRALAAGSAHTCGLSREGTILCWGGNGSGQLGDGTNRPRAAPEPVATGTRFTAVAAGGLHSCGLEEGGIAWCWGANLHGQLGDGTTTDRHAPVRVAGNTRLQDLHALGAHTCGLGRDGAPLCWGYNLEGQLGDGTRENRASPVRVGGEGR